MAIDESVGESSYQYCLQVHLRNCTLFFPFFLTNCMQWLFYLILVSAAVKTRIAPRAATKITFDSLLFSSITSITSLSLGQFKVGFRGTKTIMASRQCNPESFCASGKFLRVTLEIGLGSFRMVWKVSGESGKFPDSLESFRMVWKLSGWSGKFLDGLESFWMVWKVCGWTGNFPDGLESFRMFWKLYGGSGNFLDGLESFGVV